MRTRKNGFVLVMMCLITPIMLSLLVLSGGLLIDLNNRDLILSLCINESLQSSNDLVVLSDISLKLTKLTQEQALSWNGLWPEVEVLRAAESIFWLRVKNVSPLKGEEYWNLRCGVEMKKSALKYRPVVVVDKF